MSPEPGTPQSCAGENRATAASLEPTNLTATLVFFLTKPQWSLCPRELWEHAAFPRNTSLRKEQDPSQSHHRRHRAATCALTAFIIIKEKTDFIFESPSRCPDDSPLQRCGVPSVLHPLPFLAQTCLQPQIYQNRNSSEAPAPARKMCPPHFLF